MKKVIPLLVCLCCFLASGYGQKVNIDSLLQVLANSKEDTVKVRTLKFLAAQFTYTNPDSAIHLANESQDLAVKLNDEQGVADSYLIKGIASVKLGNNDTALKLCNDALLIYDRLLEITTGQTKVTGRSKLMKNKAAAYHTIGQIYHYQGKYPEALKVDSAGLKIKIEIGDKPGIANLYGNIAILYAEQGNYSDALKNFFASLKAQEEIGNKQGMANSYTGIGLVYWHQNKFSEALIKHTEALKLYEESGDKDGIARSYNNIGIIYKEQVNYPEALNSYIAALEIFKETGDKEGIIGALHNIGIIYEEEGNYPEALNYFFASIKIAEETGIKDRIALIYLSIGDTYVKMKNFPGAFLYMQKCLSVAKETGSISDIKLSYLSLVSLDSARGDFKSSLMNFRQYIIYRDSLVNNKNLRESEQIRMQYEFDKKEALAKHDQEEKDALAKEELHRQKLIRNFALGTIGLVLVLFFFIYRSYRARQALRLNDIRNRIAGDLHDDIGSTLNSISIYSEVARKKDEHYDEALEMIGDASRKIIEAMSDIVWTINAENDSFEKIIFRMKSLAYNLFRAKKIEFIFHSDEILNEKKLSLEERRNFYLIFKEAVNNMVKYANATRAAITLTYENNRIRLRIQDNGVGFDTTQQNAGNGLKNMKRRADEMKAGFKIESQPGSGTQIELILKV